MSNPYAPFFARLDELVPKLEDNMLDETEGPELADLVRRAAFFVANTLNTAAVASPHLILPVEGVLADGRESASSETQEAVASEPPENEPPVVS